MPKDFHVSKASFLLFKELLIQLLRQVRQVAEQRFRSESEDNHQQEADGGDSVYGKQTAQEDPAEQQPCDVQYQDGVFQAVEGMADLDEYHEANQCQ